MKKFILFFLCFLSPLMAKEKGALIEGVVLDFGGLFSKKDRSISIKFQNELFDVNTSEVQEFISTAYGKVKDLRSLQKAWEHHEKNCEARDFWQSEKVRLWLACLKSASIDEIEQ